MATVPPRPVTSPPSEPPAQVRGRSRTLALQRAKSDKEGGAGGKKPHKLKLNPPSPSKEGEDQVDNPKSPHKSKVRYDLRIGGLSPGGYVDRSPSPREYNPESDSTESEKRNSTTIIMSDFEKVRTSGTESSRTSGTESEKFKNSSSEEKSKAFRTESGKDKNSDLEKNKVIRTESERGKNSKTDLSTMVRKDSIEFQIRKKGQENSVDELVWYFVVKSLQKIDEVELANYDQVTPNLIREHLEKLNPDTTQLVSLIQNSNFLERALDDISSLISGLLRQSQLFRRKKKQFGGRKIMWVWKDQHGWNEYDQHQSQCIEAAFLRKETQFNLDWHEGMPTLYQKGYVIDFASMTQINPHTSFTRKVHRRTKVKNYKYIAWLTALWTARRFLEVLFVSCDVEPSNTSTVVTPPTTTAAGSTGTTPPVVSSMTFSENLGKRIPSVITMSLPTKFTSSKGVWENLQVLYTEVHLVYLQYFPLSDSPEHSQSMDTVDVKDKRVSKTKSAIKLTLIESHFTVFNSSVIGHSFAKVYIQETDKKLPKVGTKKHQLQKSSIKPYTQFQQWKESFIFVYEKVKQEEIRLVVEIWEENKGKECVMGKIVLPLKKITEKRYSVSSYKKKDKAAKKIDGEFLLSTEIL